MSNATVTVPYTCDRTGKTHNEPVLLQDASEFIKNMDVRKTVADEIGGYLAQLPVAPDLVLRYKGQTFILANVHEKSDDAIHKAINLILKKDVYELPPATPRKRKAKGEAAATEDEDEDVDVDAAAEE